MKPRFLIIIGIIIVASVSIIFATSFLNDKNITVSDNTPEHLKRILEHCFGSKVFVGTVNLSYYNDTHSIDTVNCKWVAESEKNQSVMIETNSDTQKSFPYAILTFNFPYDGSFSESTRSVLTDHPTDAKLVVDVRIDKMTVGGWYGKGFFPMVENTEVQIYKQIWKQDGKIPAPELVCTFTHDSPTCTVEEMLEPYSYMNFKTKLILNDIINEDFEKYMEKYQTVSIALKTDYYLHEN